PSALAVLWCKVHAVTADPNSVVFLGQSIAHAGNLTNCWVCIHRPTHPTKGIPVLGMPIPLEVWGTDSNTSFVRFPPPRLAETNCQYLRGGKQLKTVGNCPQGWKQPSVISLIGQEGQGRLSHFCDRAPIAIFTPSDGNYSVMSNLVLDGFDFYVMLGPASCNQSVSHPRMVESQRGPSYTLQVNRKCREGITPCRDFSTAAAPGLYWLFGTCTLGRVVPTVDLHSSLSWHEVSNFPPGLPRHRRAVENPLVLRYMRFHQFIRAFLPWLGVPELEKAIINISGVMENFINASVGQVTVENRMALDYLLATQGGVCAVENHMCCTWIDQHQRFSNAVSATWD
uniref:Uncharacterized protein n=1 Tax=Crocodylus porosus TaxID=8502 RepID=A0A7M4FPL2_CROPO